MNKVILMGRLTSDPKNGLDTFRGFQTVRHIYISSQSAVQKEWTGRYRFYLLHCMGSHGGVCRKIYEKRCHVRC